MFNYCEQKEGESGDGEEKQRQRENGMNDPYPEKSMRGRHESSIPSAGISV